MKKIISILVVVAALTLSIGVSATTVELANTYDIAVGTELTAANLLVDGVAPAEGVVTDFNAPTTEAGLKIGTAVVNGEAVEFAYMVGDYEKDTTTVPYESVAVSTFDSDAKAVEVKLGTPVTLTYTINEDATNKAVKFYSLDETIATVADGVVTGVALGKTTVMAVTADGAKVINYDINVTAADIEAGLVGTLVDGDTNAPIYGATLSYDDWMLGEVVVVGTDANGMFKLPTDASYMLGEMTITADGYITRVISFDTSYDDVVAELGKDGISKLYKSFFGDGTNDGKIDSNDVNAILYSESNEIDYGEN